MNVIIANPYLKLGAHAKSITSLVIAGSVLMFAWLTWHGAPLARHTPEPFPGILALEFCSNQRGANAVLDAWADNTSDRDATLKLTAVAVRDIYWDFLFIVAYVSGTMLLCGMVATRLSGRWATYLLILAWAQPVAGVLDIVENIGMLNMLRAGQADSSFVPLLTTVSAVTKFLIVGLGMASLSVGAIVSIRGESPQTD